jgi:hypothetical protein
MVMYDLDRFRRFIFQSPFLEKFPLNEEVKQRVFEDDLELLKFGFDYLKMAFKVSDSLKQYLA